jgi:hypothetical protein
LRRTKSTATEGVSALAADVNPQWSFEIDF